MHIRTSVVTLLASLTLTVAATAATMLGVLLPAASPRRTVARLGLVVVVDMVVPLLLSRIVVKLIQASGRPAARSGEPLALTTQESVEGVGPNRLF